MKMDQVNLRQANLYAQLFESYLYDSAFILESLKSNLLWFNSKMYYCYHCGMDLGEDRTKSYCPKCKSSLDLSDFLLPTHLNPLF
ncbi:MAG: hypothetical protein EAX96_09905 [Candidatus Lokiarchaeota archaeon]|nr:hypothetical protein [Candidatus Lokiarchaeota archaeon]